MRSTALSSAVVLPWRLPERCLSRIIPFPPRMQPTLDRCSARCRDDAQDLVAVGGAAAAAVAVAGGHVELAVGSHQHVAQAARPIVEVDLVQLDDRRVLVAELDAVE